MRYLIAILCPPLAVLSCGKPVQFVLNCILTLLMYFPGLLHAILVVDGYHEDRRTARIVRALRGHRDSIIGMVGRPLCYLACFAMWSMVGLCGVVWLLVTVV